MSTLLGSLLVELGLESGTFKSGLTAAQKELQRAQQQFQKIGAEMQKFGAALTVGVTAPLVAAGASAVKGFIEQEKAVAQVNSALASMGNAAGRTSAQLTAAAGKMEMNSLFDAEVILTQVTANLLTFGNVAGKEFDRAQQAAVDMATRLGGEPQAAALMLGKALNDPVKGITALTRVGVQFTDQQKAQIAAMQAAGNTAGAQGIILAEVERQFKGAAEAAADATPWRKAEVAIGDAMDKIGAAILPLIPPVTDAIVSLVNGFTSLPAPVQEGIVVFAGVAAAVGPAVIALGSLVSIAPKLVTSFADIKKAALFLMANPAILGFAAVVGGIYLAWQNWDKITAIVSRMYNGVRTWLVDKLGGIFNWLDQRVKEVTGFFFEMYDAVVGHSYVPDMVDEIGQHMSRLQGLMVDPARSATQSVTEATRQMASDVAALLDRLFPQFAEARKQTEELKLLDDAASKGLISDGVRSRGRMRVLGGGGNATVSDWLKNGTEPLVKATEDVGRAMEGLRSKTEVQTVRIAQTFEEMSRNAISSLQQLAGAIKGGGFLDILSSIVGIGLQLGQMGAFGGKVQASLNKPIPGYANGTNFARGGLSLVGERGPEVLNIPRGAGVMTNKELRGLASGTHITVGVDPRSGNLIPFVDGRIASLAPAVASAGAMQAQGMAARTARRSLR